MHSTANEMRPQSQTETLVLDFSLSPKPGFSRSDLSLVSDFGLSER